MSDWFCTVFPNDPSEMPQDFPSYEAAKEYGNEMFPCSTTGMMMSLPSITKYQMLAVI